MKKDDLDDITAGLIDKLVDTYTTLDHAYYDTDVDGVNHLLIKCIDGKAYRIKIELAGKLHSVPWSH